MWRTLQYTYTHKLMATPLPQGKVKCVDSCFLSFFRNPYYFYVSACLLKKREMHYKRTAEVVVTACTAQ